MFLVIWGQAVCVCVRHVVCSCSRTPISVRAFAQGRQGPASQGRVTWASLCKHAMVRPHLPHSSQLGCHTFRQPAFHHLIFLMLPPQCLCESLELLVSVFLSTTATLHSFFSPSVHWSESTGLCADGKSGETRGWCVACCPVCVVWMELFLPLASPPPSLCTPTLLPFTLIYGFLPEVCFLLLLPPSSPGVLAIDQNMPPAGAPHPHTTDPLSTEDVAVDQ